VNTTLIHAVFAFDSVLTAAQDKKLIELFVSTVTTIRDYCTAGVKAWADFLLKKHFVLVSRGDTCFTSSKSFSRYDGSG
jgi:hypothetical protein